MGRERIYETAAGTLRLESNWEALHIAFERRCGWQFDETQQIRLQVDRVPAHAMPEKPAEAMKVLDAHVTISERYIHATVPDPSFSAGILIDWLWLALARFCCPPGWQLLHAAAVADGEDVTLIAGASGAGKTTALLAMLDVGCQYVSDDAVLWQPETGRIRPWTCDLHLMPEQIVDRWPELIGPTIDFNGKIRVGPQQLGHDAGMGGKLTRVIMLASEGDNVHLSHEGVGMAEPVRVDVFDGIVPIEWWGRVPMDLTERIAAGRLIASPPLAICTPFSGKTWLLERWLNALSELGLPPDTRFLWLCNSDDDEFWHGLQDHAERLGNVSLWRDTHHVGMKDRQVAYLWQQIRTRLPEEVTLIMTLEDDVLPDAGAFIALLREWSRRGGRDMVGAPVAHTYMHGEVTALAWNYETAAAHTDPRFIIADGVVAHEAMPRLGPDRVSGLSFSCSLISRDLFDEASLAHGPDAYTAGGYDHQFCMDIAARGAEIIAHWGVGATHVKREMGGVRDVRLNARRVLLVGEGQHVPDGTRYAVIGHTTPAELPAKAGEADYALYCSPSEHIGPAYMDALVDHLTWHPHLGAVWGYARQQDGRIAPAGGDSGVLVRLDAAREAPYGDLPQLREYMHQEGWQEGHTDRAAFDYLAADGLPAYESPHDAKRAASPYHVLMLNRHRYRGAWPGFGGDFTQIDGYRRGLRALGIWADLRGGQFWWHDDYQVIHLHHHQYDWAWEIAETCNGRRPVVLSAITHGRPPRSIMGRAVGLADLVVCYSRSEAEFLSEKFPERADRMRVVPMGVNPQLYSANGPPPSEPSVLMAGKFCAYKNQLAVLRACLKLDVPVTFAGFNEDPVSDPYVEEFRKAVADYPRATLAGFLHGTDLWDAYHAAHVHVNASQFEPFGQVTLDALTLGCNVVHTRESWAADLFAERGSLCDPADEESIGVAIEAELRKPRGWAKARPPTWMQAARALAEVYEEALAR